MGFNQLIMNMNCSGCEREDGWYPCPEYVFSSNSTLLTTSKYQQSVVNTMSAIYGRSWKQNNRSV